MKPDPWILALRSLSQGQEWEPRAGCMAPTGPRSNQGSRDMGARTPPSPLVLRAGKGACAELQTFLIPVSMGQVLALLVCSLAPGSHSQVITGRYGSVFVSCPRCAYHSLPGLQMLPRFHQWTSCPDLTGRF